MRARQIMSQPVVTERNPGDTSRSSIFDAISAWRAFGSWASRNRAES
jgi:hypothetical protein